MTLNRKNSATPGMRQALALPIELEEGAPPLYARSALAIVTGLVFALMVWANVATIREVSLAHGNIETSEAIHHVAHLEGGIVDSISVTGGEVVQRGDELVLLRKESADNNYGRNAARRADLQLRAIRYGAEADGVTPDFSEFVRDWPGLVAEHKSTFQTTIAKHEISMTTHLARASAMKAEVAGAKSSVLEKAEQLKLAEEQLEIQKKLIGDGFTSKQQFLTAKSAVLAARGALATAKSLEERALSDLQSAENEIEKFDAELRATALERRAEAVAELAELEKSYYVSADREDRLTIRAPIDGVINAINVSGSGQVIRPGEIVLDIVPTNATLIANVRVNPDDIGYISIGQRAEVTISAFDKKKYGVIDGKISYISADAARDEKTGETFFQVHIEFAGKDATENTLIKKISPGMKASSKIITGSKSMLVYMIKPIASSVDGAFSEK